ncbi:MAG TPA: oxidoreductase [Rhodobacteraceae bacterium]|nr:NAD(P)-dependent oxidoreductase [Amylibacter sp.]HAD29843.1 oxidoreductase [Paracoccaceae bacterium]|tara:strand:- start:109 stop:972 length:864 start_codon:yes stop_codon:yes gene_type:complete
MAKLAFLGMGVMGYPMAGHLSAKGHEVTVYNRTRAKAKKWILEYGGISANTPREAASDADIVFACVGNDEDLRSVFLGEDGALAGMTAGSTFVDHTTTSATVAIELAGVANASDIGFIDAPVSGGQAGAENGQLTVMCGGKQNIYDSVENVINSFAKSCRLMGDHGAGQLTKMVNQICIAGLVQGLSEGMYFAKKAGLDGEAVLDVISKGAAGSWQMENRGTTMLKDEFDFGFAVDWMRKDLGIILDEAKNNGSSLPVTALVNQFYGDVQNMGGGRWDTSSLMRRLK